MASWDPFGGYREQRERRPGSAEDSDDGREDAVPSIGGKADGGHTSDLLPGLTRSMDDVLRDARDALRGRRV